MTLRILLFLLYFFVGFIPALGSAEKIGPQWIYLSVLNIISFIISYRNIISLKHLHLIFKIQIGLILLGFLSLFYSLNKVETLIETSRLILIFSSCFNLLVLVKVIGYKNLRKILLFLFPTLLFLESAYVIFDFLKLKDAFFALGRQQYVNGTAANINITAFSLVIKGALCFFIFKQEKKFFLKLITSLLLIVGFISIYITGSRGGLLAIYSITIFYVIFTIIEKNKKFSKKTFEIALLVFPLFISIIVTEIYFSENKMNPVYRTQEIVNRGSKSRLNYYSHALSSFAEKPILGVGLGNWKLYSIEADKDQMSQYIVPYHAHNDFLQILAELGIFGFFLFSSMFILPIYIIYFSFFRPKKFMAEIVIISSVIIVLLIDSNLNFPVSRPIIQVPFMFVLSLLIFLSSIEKNEK